MGQYGAQKYTADSYPFASQGRKFDVLHSFPVPYDKSTGGSDTLYSVEIFFKKFWSDVFSFYLLFF
jgi:hypothetical protein